MPRISMKLIASAVGSLALVSAVACQQRGETPQPDPATTTPAQEPNALRPTPSASSPGMGGASSVPSTAPVEEIETQPVRGIDPDTQGSGAGGAGGHGGHGGHAGHAGKAAH